MKCQSCLNSDNQLSLGLITRDEAMQANQTLSECKEDGARRSPLDEYFHKGMDTTGPESWKRLPQRMESGQLENVGVVNQQAGIREEK